MPQARRRTVYPAAIALTGVLMLIGIVTTLVRPHLPLDKPNRLLTEPGDYVQAGSHQRIDWYPLGPEAFTQARLRDRPLFVVIGDQWCLAARMADELAFRDSEVVERLNQDFVCVRVDTSIWPAWQGVFLPVTRGDLDFDPGFQIWVLDPRLRLIFSALRNDPNVRTDYRFILQAAKEARATWLRYQELDPDLGAPGAEQASDLAIMNLAPEANPDFVAFNESIRKAIALEGGFPERNFQYPRPNAYRYLARMGETQALRASLDPLLRSCLVDWLDGGFFRVASSRDMARVEADQLAVANAEMAWCLALAWTKRRDPLYRELALRTFDTLVDRFSEDGYVRAYRIDQTRLNGRSVRAGFDVAELRAGWWTSTFDAADRRWLAEHLGLDPAENPQMVARLVDPEDYLRDPTPYNRMLDRLRKVKHGIEMQYGGERLADVNGFVSARLAQVARVFGDAARVRQASDLFDRLALFRSGADDIVHSDREGLAPKRWLGDYLGYADAALQDYLATGRLASIRKGRAVLMRALELFEDDDTGLIACELDSDLNPAPPDVRGPQIADDTQESSAAALIRILYGYSCLYRSLGVQEDLATDGRYFLDSGTRAVRRLSSAALRLGVRGAGFFWSASALLEDRCAIVVGPDALEVANRLSALAPDSFVAPAFGEIRPVLQGRGHGVYVIEHSVAKGPLTVEEAASRLNP